MADDIALDQVVVGGLSGPIDHFGTAEGYPQTREEVDALKASDRAALTAFAWECEAEPADPEGCLSCYAYMLLTSGNQEPLSPQPEPPRWSNDDSNNAAIDSFVAAERQAQRTVLQIAHEEGVDVVLLLDGGHSVSGKVTRVLDMVVDINGLMLDDESGESVTMTWSVNRSRVVAVGRP